MKKEMYFYGCRLKELSSEGAFVADQPYPPIILKGETKINININT